MWKKTVMYGSCMDPKEGGAPKNWCFWTVVLEKTPESPLNSMEIKPVNLKGNQPWILIGSVRRLCNFLGSVSSQPKFEVIDVKALGVSQLSDSFTAEFYLENKGKHILKAWEHADPKDAKRERERVCAGERERDPRPFGSSFYMFFTPPGPALCKLG